MFQRITIKPEIFFLFAALIFGVFYNFVTPALQVPDEFAHFNRAYRISEGDFLPVKKDNRLGGDIPYSIREFEELYHFTATTLEYNIPGETDSVAFTIPFTKEKHIFTDFPNTSYYSPVSYIPHSFCLAILKQTGCSVGALYYYTRIFSFFVWMIAMFIFIRQVPVYKWFFVFVCLIPMHLYIANSFSADTVSNILSFLFFGAVLKYAFDSKEVTWKRLTYLLIIGVLLGLAKLVYVGVVLSILLIPAEKFRGRINYFLRCGLVIGASFVIAYGWSKVVMQYYMSHAQYNPAFRAYLPLVDCADYYKQKAFILEHPFYFFKVIFHTLFDHPYTYLNSYIGNFGNYDIPLPKWVTVLGWTVILTVVIFEIPAFKLKIKQKLILAGAAFAAFCLLLLSQHLTWDCVGEGVVDFLHGRYLIPIFPFVLLLLGGLIKNSKFKVALLVIPFAFVLNIAGIKRVNDRYHKEWFSEEIKFTCGGEEQKNGLLITSNTNILLEGAACRTDSVAHSGKASLMLSPASPYCFTYRFKNLSKGDRIEIFAWQKGSGAQFVLTGKAKNCEEFYSPTAPLIWRDSTQWQKVHMMFIMGKECDSLETTFFMWNPNNSKVFIDDLEFSHKKFPRDYLQENLTRLSLFN